MTNKSNELNDNNMEDVFEQMLEAQCDELKKESESQQQESKKMSDVLKKYMNYIKSMRFDQKCKSDAKKMGVKNYKIVKNVYIESILKKIANVLGLVINITGEVILFAVEFLQRIITVAVNFASSVCHKIINLFTLNCGDAVA